MDGPSAVTKSAELSSSLSAIVLGGGLALVLLDWLRAYALPLIVGSLVVHGAGMTLKYRLESRDGLPLWWGLVLAMLGLLDRARPLARRRLHHCSVARPH